MTVTKVAVLGATGRQGGTVADALSRRGVSVVALTRDPTSTAAVSLGSRSNISVSQADLNSTESLMHGFQGCDGCFVVANFWEGCNVDVEIQQYRNVVDALKQVGGFKHVVFSTLDDTRGPLTDDLPTMHECMDPIAVGPMKVPQFDGKARAEKLFDGLPTTFVLTSGFYENFGSMIPVQDMKDGSYAFFFPMGKARCSWTTMPDLGQFVANIFQKPEWIGKKVGQASFFATGDELADIASKAAGKIIKFNDVPWQVFGQFPFPGAALIANMGAYLSRTEKEQYSSRDPEIQAKIMDGIKYVDPVEYGQTMQFLFVE